MSQMQDVEAKAISTTKGKDPLQTGYFCQVTQNQSVEVVMELTAIESSAVRRMPLRYVLVIDVSGSMDGFVGDEATSLLDRVKTFAELMIQNISSEDSLAIVTFSHDVEINMQLTPMSKAAKAKAKSIVERLHTRGNTNLEIGLMTGLEVIAQDSNQNVRDCIILFTDGAANDGETDPEKLVKEYKEFQASFRKKTCIPLSAFTIGSYPPILLAELAKYLGSEAFYWLNEHEEFEADLLIPVFLREFTRVTDINIEMTSLQNVTFDLEATSTKNLEESTPTSLKYFVHSVPMSKKKHIPLTLVLPQQDLKDGERIMDIKVTYFDGKLNQRRINDMVVLSGKTLRQCKAESTDTTESSSNIMDEICAFTMTHNKLVCTWIGAQKSLVAVAGERLRRVSIIAIHNAECYIAEQDDAKAKGAFGEAVLEINKIKQTYSTMLGADNQYMAEIASGAAEWVSKLNFGQKLVSLNNMGRLFAMQSSIDTEMPTAKGVFDPKLKQPYLPPQVERKLKQYEKIVKKAKKEKQTFETTSVFKAQNLVVSESLRDKKVGIKQETMSELIIRCGGRPVPNVNTVYNNTLLICSAADYKKNTVLVRDSKHAKIPIVREQFIYDCIRQKKIVDLDRYLIEPGKN